MQKSIFLAVVAMFAVSAAFAQVHYEGRAGVGYAAVVAQNGVNHLAVETVHGVRVNPYFFGGAGAGLNYYTSERTLNGHFYGNVRGYLLDKSVTPFLSMDMGYGLYDGGGGLYTSPALGVSWRAAKHCGFAFSAGLQTQGISKLGLKWSEKYLFLRLEVVF